MNIVVGANDNLTGVTEYFDFNRIPYDSISLWDPSFDGGRTIIPNSVEQSESTLLVINSATFLELASWAMSHQQLINFCSTRSNKIWVWSDIDGLVTMITMRSTLVRLDKCVSTSSIDIFVDGKLSNRHPLTRLQNIHYHSFPYNFFMRLPRIQNTVVNKIGCTRDFILTMIKKNERPHRDILFNQLVAISGLSNRGHINYTSPNGKRIGLQPHQHSWADGHPSMDLYRDAWVEIAPETLYRDGYYITEKTIKPIATKTPFLTVSTCQYLEYLKQQGFKTFDSVIDESYDQQPRIEDRVRLMLTQLQDIIHNGAEAFYKDCAPILEHNQNRLFEINGCTQYSMDIFISEKLAALGIK